MWLTNFRLSLRDEFKRLLEPFVLPCQPRFWFGDFAPSPSPAPEALPLDSILLGKKWRLGRQQGSMAGFRSIGGTAILAGVMMLPMLADSV